MPGSMSPQNVGSASAHRTVPPSRSADGRSHAGRRESPAEARSSSGANSGGWWSLLGAPFFRSTTDGIEQLEKQSGQKSKVGQFFKSLPPVSFARKNLNRTLKGLINVMFHEPSPLEIAATKLILNKIADYLPPTEKLMLKTFAKIYGPLVYLTKPIRSHVRNGMLKLVDIVAPGEKAKQQPNSAPVPQVAVA